MDFDVTVDDSSIDIAYLKDYAGIAIEITDEAGQLAFSEVVNPVSGKSLIIDISDWAEGSYHISFTNSAGDCIYGDFDIVH